ncbi:MAG: isoprenylcysteine carboxylmethyltransferase family protein [Acidobacteriota bacterium]
MNFLDFFQLSSVALFLVIVVLRASHLRLTRKINPIAIGRGKKGFSLAFELIAFAALLIWMFEVVLHALHSTFHVFPDVLERQLFESVTARCIGVGLVTAAFVLFSFAFLSFGSSWRVGLDTQTPGSLVTSGTFALTRNPIFVSLNLWFSGVFLMNGSVGFLIFALLAAIGMHWQILREEKFLTGLYGRRYRDYRARTARYFIWF